jgi:hypothetical protein
LRGHQIVPKFGKRVTDVLKGMLRPSLLAAPGKVLVVADWAAIEARANPWLSGRGDDKLAIFAKGEDVYKVNAAATFGVRVDEVTKDQRRECSNEDPPAQFVLPCGEWFGEECPHNIH